MLEMKDYSVVGALDDQSGIIEYFPIEQSIREAEIEKFIKLAESEAMFISPRFFMWYNEKIIDRDVYLKDGNVSRSEVEKLIVSVEPLEDWIKGYVVK